MLGDGWVVKYNLLTSGVCVVREGNKIDSLGVEGRVMSAVVHKVKNAFYTVYN